MPQYNIPVYPSLVGGGGGSPTRFNINPSARTGTGAYGKVPGATGLPSPYNDLSSIYPNLSGSNAQVSQNIMSELRGELSPETLNSIRDSAATYGVSSGMPGSGLQTNRALRDIGIASEQLQGKGLQDYLSAITGIKGTQTVSPESQISLSQSNAALGAAPDPEAAAKEQQRIFDEYLKKVYAQAPVAGGVGGKSQRDYILHSYGMGLGGATPWYSQKEYL